MSDVLSDLMDIDIEFNDQEKFVKGILEELENKDISYDLDECKELVQYLNDNSNPIEAFEQNFSNSFDSNLVTSASQKEQEQWNFCVEEVDCVDDMGTLVYEYEPVQTENGNITYRATNKQYIVYHPAINFVVGQQPESLVTFSEQQMSPLNESSQSSEASTETDSEQSLRGRPGRPETDEKKIETMKVNAEALPKGSKKRKMLKNNIVSTEYRRRQKKIREQNEVKFRHEFREQSQLNQILNQKSKAHTENITKLKGLLQSYGFCVEA